MPRVRLTAVLIALVLLGAGVVVGRVIAQSSGSSTAARTALAQSTKVKGAPKRTLGLSRVTIPSGGGIPLHHHDGTQVAYVQHGVLAYSVQKGSVTVRTGPADDSRFVRRIPAGRTGRIAAGQWIVEQPGTIHRARNKGKTKVLIYLATLLRTGAPASTPN